MSIFSHRFILFTALLFLGMGCLAQADTMASRQVEIIQDDKVGLLLEKHIKINETLKTMEGFRIQVFSDSGNNSKTRAQAVQEEVAARFPELGIYLSFKSPNYRIRVGDFRTRLDAQRFLTDISVEYPNAFIVNDMINLPKQTN
jgi:hypothetical protein